MRLDIYNHIFPMKFFERMGEVMKDKRPIKRWLNIPMLYDLDARLKIMDTFGDYQQILSLSMPPIEFIGGPNESPALARLANDGMAEICRKYPQRFPSFIASLPMNNVKETEKEIDRAIKELGACGIQIFSNVNGRPLDEPEFWPVFEKMAQHDLPIWLHPARGANFPDYATEKKSKYEIWWTIGWPYETSAAMCRLVFSGLFDRLPHAKIIIHHLGAMIPYFAGRFGPGLDQLGSRTADENYEEILDKMKAKGRRPLDYFKMFYADTAVFGADAATECGIDFFGVERCMFASDCPFDPEGGPMYIRETIRILDALDVTKGQREQLYISNAKKLLKMK
jgi:predicted TIM-barrel fold metal-dependent hydrolase